MGTNIEGLKNHWKIKTDTAIAKVDEAIKKLSTNGLKINFNTISKEIEMYLKYKNNYI